ncbi:hypothetical protein FGO68_gene10261 [Halteria grandinella]|uniref:Uncharacterized protein n=1 Tax=Halteria grandinella TaxID=5974 RepID=A0A8J8T6B7_HALGN|nr:hypothetical protein FGO68_gene10261 [Halteria grandinella]
MEEWGAFRTAPYVRHGLIRLVIKKWMSIHYIIHSLKSYIQKLACLRLLPTYLYNTWGLLLANILSGAPKHVPPLSHTPSKLNINRLIYNTNALHFRLIFNIKVTI